MSKRRKAVPQRASEEKRQCLSWNMLDNPVPSGSLSILSDNDPSLLKEIHDANNHLELENDDIQKQKQGHVGGLNKNDNSLTLDINEVFGHYLSDSLFYFSVFDKINVRQNEFYFEIGNFKVQLTSASSFCSIPENLPQTSEFWLYVSEIPGRSMVYYELGGHDENNPENEQEKSVLFWCVNMDLPVQVLEAFEQQKMFQVVLSSYDSHTCTLDLVVYGREGLIANPQISSEHVRPRNYHKALQAVIEHFYNIPCPSFKGLSYTKKHDVEELYLAVKEQHLQKELMSVENVQHSSLKPLLRPYQKQAVNWMLYKEKNANSEVKSEGIGSVTNRPLHRLYQEIVTPDGTVLYYNRHVGSLVQNKFLTVDNPPGGILADEMGLGKTVEVLACMLTHPRKDIKPPERLPSLTELQAMGDISEDHFWESRLFSVDSSDSKTDFNSDSTVMAVDDESSQSFKSNETFSIGAISNTGETDIQLNSISDNSNVSLIQADMCTEGQGHDNAEDIPDKVKNECETIVNGLDNLNRSNLSATNSPACDSDHNLIKQNSENNSNGTMANSTAETGDIEQDEKKLCTEDSVKQKLQNSEFSQIENEVENNDKHSSRENTSDHSCITLDNSNEMDQSDSAKPLSSESNFTHTEEEDKNYETVDDEIEFDNQSNQQKNRAQKRRSKKKKWTTAKPAQRRKSREQMYQKKSEKIFITPGSNDSLKKTKSSSRFVQLVEESSFTPKNIFNIKDQARPQNFFECICGEKDKYFVRNKKLKKHKVQCVKCGLFQHAECVNYDLNDPYRGEFKCPHCHVSSPPVVSGATLIISPSAICHQWVDEILKHIKEESLKVFVYSGVNKQGFVQPMTLAQQDIVITTYETLRKEIDYVDLPHSNSENGRKFRHPKRFMAIPSPIIAVEWWRICLDEAQMVECTTTKTAAMALRLSAVNRWCVTGTPIQKSVEDLYGLLVFLGVDPYWVQQWWTKLLYEPFCYGIHQPLYDVVTNVLWRTAKKDVIDQINLPEQTEHLHWLTFSPVEEHFYRRQYHNSINDAMKRLSKWTDSSTKLSSLDKHTMSQLLYPLLRLRQACCHPQAVRGEFIPIQKTTMTMEELLESLTKKATTECEEAHRQLVGALNGLAALHIIKEEYVEAVEKYRDVLRSVEEHKGQLRTDDLQQLHAMYNLHEILGLKPKGVSPTLRDDQLLAQCKELKEKYMTKAGANVTAAQEQLLPVQKHVRELQVEFADGSDWWVDVVQKVSSRGIDESLIDHVKDELTKGTHHPNISMARTFHSVNGLELAIVQRLEALESAHDKLLNAIRMLSVKRLDEEVINQTVECCLRPVGEVLNSCPFCHADNLFEEYESKLFSFEEKGLMLSADGETAQVSTKRQGTWADSELEKALKAVLSFAKVHRVDKYLVQYGNIHIKLFETLKKEFRPLRNVWMYLREEVSAIDELDMAKTRLRLRLSEEPKPDTPQLNILERCEVDQHRLKLISEKTIGKNELRKKLGQLVYLKNLAKTQGEGEDVQGLSQDCPICQREMGAEWSVLHCGHCYCLDCIRVMVEQYSFGGHNPVVKCAICRQRTHRSDISFVSTKKSIDTKNGDDFTVKGSHSTKVEGIVRCLMKIKRDDPTAKALVFSSWTDVLNVIARALEDNDITHRTLYTGGKFQQHLSAFREQSDITALLLPVHSGANGLNLIEATYVLMVEPILNPAQELQAIGRVHRIGQTHQTQVHRFLVRGTIEQKMYSMLKSIEESPSSHDTEENRLTIGDLTSLLREEREGTDELSEDVIDDQNFSFENDQEPVIPQLNHGNEVNMMMSHNNHHDNKNSSCNQRGSIYDTDEFAVPSCSSSYSAPRLEASIENGHQSKEKSFYQGTSLGDNVLAVPSCSSSYTAPIVEANNENTYQCKDNSCCSQGISQGDASSSVPSCSSSYCAPRVEADNDNGQQSTENLSCNQGISLGDDLSSVPRSSSS